MHPAEANLTQTEAMLRAQIISDVKYQLAVEMDNASETFHGTAQIEFSRKDSPHDLFLDLKNGAKIEKFEMNGKAYTPVFMQHRVILPQAMLAVGANKVVIAYTQSYDHNGRGLNRFVDPEDKRVYFHSQFEAYDAHQMFPCFDQPDIKATMRMTVTAPKAWEVISTTRETSKKVSGDNAIWTFAETPKISTYLFSLHAGPFAKWESKAGNIPLRLFARQALKKFVVAKDWFTPTKAGLKFYGEYFGYPYPFKKYDQIIVPEFTAGAMENVAAITFTERFIHRSAATYKEREGLSSVILHEMAHMWFGDLVTMQWWNGLWLNESFATYMSALSMSRATEFKDSWMSFYSGGKTGAYVEDQLVTTHPIEANIPDTDTAFSNFDSITYGKGASVLKQLSFYLGEDMFRNGLKIYFKNYAYSNSRLEDFLGSLEQASGKDLKTWSKTWLEMAGVDTVSAEYTCDAGKVTGFALKLIGPNGEPTLREHRTQVGLFQEKNGKIVPLKTANVLYKGERTEVAELNGLECPAMVYPNDQDQDYVKVSIDPRTLETAKTSLSKIASPFTRLMFWPNLYSMVRDMQLMPQDYLKMVVENLPGETDLTIGNAIMRSLGRVIVFLPQATDAQKQTRLALIGDVEKAVWKKIDGKTSADWKKMALETYSDIAESQQAKDNLMSVLEGKIKWKGVVIDADRRWDMIIRLSALGDSRVEPILAHQREVDKSSRGVDNALAADASKPSLEVKNEWITKILSRADMSYDQKRTILRNFLPRQQDDLRASLSDKYYSTLPGLVKTADLEFSDLYAGSMVPATCTQASALRIGNFLTQEAGALPTPVIKILRTSLQEDSRCVAIRAKASN